MRWIRLVAVLTIGVLTFQLAGCGGDCLQLGGCDNESQTTNSNNANSSSDSVFARSGTGDTVFNLPSTVKFITISGTFEGTSSNFVVRIAGNLKVNELLGTSWDSTSFSGNYAVDGGGLVEITGSTGVSWTISSFTPS